MPVLRANTSLETSKRMGERPEKATSAEFNLRDCRGSLGPLGRLQWTYGSRVAFHLRKRDVCGDADHDDGREGLF